MNFFQHQDQARKRTTLLVTLLVAAVALLIAVTVFAIGFFLFWLQGNSTSIGALNYQNTSFAEHMAQLAISPVALWVAIGVITVVSLGSLYKWSQLGGGGRRVAESLGGKPIDPSSRDALERKVLNVVEEMAIASGNPVPPVYVLEDESINAFAAGLHRRDAVIGVTRGTIKFLTRDELQGVIAHEFSHIHNGDMRLNMKLIAILHGILMIGLAGQLLVRSSGSYRRGYSSSYSSSRSRDSGHQFGLGLALMAIGYGGTFFGGIIKAAVSRQREFLADASAVQFTRNPSGISGALKKIGGLPSGSEINHSKASEFSHFYFGSGVQQFFGGFMATHPPLKTRIQRIEPRWKGNFPTVEEVPVLETSDDVPPVSHFQSQASANQNTESLSEAIEYSGDPRAENLHAGDVLLIGLPSSLKDAAHQAFSARALIYALLLDSSDDIRSAQIDYLKKNAHPATFKQFSALTNEVIHLPKEQHFTLVNLCAPALKQQSSTQFSVFKRNLLALIKADKKITLFEWCIYRLVVKNATNEPNKNALSGSASIRANTQHVDRLILAVTLAGGNQQALAAYNSGRKVLGLNEMNEMPKAEENFVALDQSLNQLEKLAPLQKPKLLKAIAAIIEFDGKVTQEEEVLFRVVSDTLDCPIPPSFIV